MSTFTGFPEGKTPITPVPTAFFTELLPEIDHLGELKITLAAIWYLNNMEGSIRFVPYEDLMNDARLISSIGGKPGLDDALERAVQRGTFLKAIPEDGNEAESVFFLNSPRGRAALKTLEEGKWSPGDISRPNVRLQAERPNIYRLYEENIGALTPLIAQALEEAEKQYPVEWIEDAFRIAVENNVRRWKYMEAILKSWQERGRDETHQRDSEKSRKRYTEGKYGDLIEH